MSAISSKPCWCNCDNTAEGHRHRSTDGGTVPDSHLYVKCPDCDGRGSISVMDGQGRETESQCERCYHSGGYVKVAANTVRRITTSDGTLPTFEEIVEAREVLTKIIEGLEAGVLVKVERGNP